MFTGIVYRITSPSHHAIYIGSTKRTLANRMGKHKSDHQRFTLGEGHYISAFALLEDGEAVIEPIAAYQCQTLRELHEHEQRAMDECQLDLVNCNRAIRVPNDEYCREWRRRNREYVREQRAVRYACECGGSFNVSHRATHKRTGRHRQWEAGQVNQV